MNRIKQFCLDYIPTALVFLALGILYKVGTDTGALDGYLFPKITKIVESFQKYLPQMLLNMLYSFQILFPGMLGGTILGLLFGVPLGLNAKLRKIFHPVVYAFSVVPAILLSPFLLHLAPTFRIASGLMVFYNAIWATLFASINGIMAIDKRFIDKAATLQINGLKRIFMVILPAAMPSMVAGFITSMRSSFVILVYAELVGTKYGMGYFVKWASDLGRFDNVWSGFLYMVVVLVTLMLILEVVKNKLLKWAL